MAYTFDQVFAVDESNTSNVAKNASVLIFAPGDTSRTPLTLTTTDGQPLANPIVVNDAGFGDAFMHETLDRVAWEGAGYTGFFSSYEGMKNEAVAARQAAEQAAANAAAEAEAELSARIAAGEFKGEPGADGSNVLPTDDAIEQAIKTPGTKTEAVLTATYGTPKLDKTEAQATYAYESAVDARKHGLPTSGTADASPALNAAANAARAAGRPLFIPKGTLYIDSTVNMRNLDVFCEANIVVRHTNAIGVIVGDVSTQRNARRIEFVSVQHTGTTLLMWDWPYPALQVIGLKGSTLRLGNVSLLELYANGSVAADDSIAYNLFELQRVNHLRLWGVNGTGWINENTYLGGSYQRITVGGSYQHNNNKWISPSVEGSSVLIDIQNGSQNLFENARAEGGTQVKFGANTWKNIVQGLYLANPAIIAPPFTLVEDLGTENEILSRDHLQLSAHTVFKIDGTAPLFDTAGAFLDQTKPMPIPAVGRGKLAIRTQNQRYLDTGLIKIEEARNAALDFTSAPPSRVTRFVLHSDASILRPYVSAYDANGVLIDANVTAWASPYGGFTAQASGEYGFGTSVSSMLINVINPAVKYLRFAALTSLTTNPLFTHITLTAYVQGSKQPGVIESMRQAINRPLFGTAKPAQGLAWPGTVVQGAATSWKATARAETTLSALASAGATTVTVTAATGMAVGDVIGILQSDGRTHWTTISALAGTAVTLTAAIVADATVGGAVGTTRWV